MLVRHLVLGTTHRTGRIDVKGLLTASIDEPRSKKSSTSTWHIYPSRYSLRSARAVEGRCASGGVRTVSLERPIDTGHSSSLESAHCAAATIPPAVDERQYDSLLSHFSPWAATAANEPTTFPPSTCAGLCLTTVRRLSSPSSQSPPRSLRLAFKPCFLWPSPKRTNGREIRCTSKPVGRTVARPCCGQL